MKRRHENNLPSDYEVIGEDAQDATRLLLIGSDGDLYALCLTEDCPARTEFSDRWVLDGTVHPEKLRLVSDQLVSTR